MLRNGTIVERMMLNDNDYFANFTAIFESASVYYLFRC